MKSSLLFFLATLICAVVIFPLKGNSQAVVVQTAVRSDISIPLRDMKPAKKPFFERFKRENEMEVPNKFRPPHPGYMPDGAIQPMYNVSLKGGMLAPIVNFDGTNNSANSGRVTPPDPAGDIGPNHYVQVVNSMLQIFSKTGTSLYGPVLTSTLWSGFSGNWDGHNNGDGIVLYDENADRWIISQFAIDCPGSPLTEYEMVAVSVTGDPTGAYYRYAFQFDYMPDYPKLGVWQDGYYMAVNRFNTNSGSTPYIGAGACVLERSKMLTGDANARMIYFKTESIGGTGSGEGAACWSMMPSDCDGTFPAAGTPNYFVYDDQPASELRIWALHPDWTTTQNSTFTYITALPVAGYTELGSVPQMTGSISLDGLGDRLMFRNQYRNFGGYESFLTCRSVNAGSGVAGIRWYEYRKTGLTFSLYQQSTFAPADGKSRWMGSIAMNASGDIGLAYSVSSSTMYPSIYYTGRKASDPINQMTMTEGIIQTGTVAMTTYSRWGDYSTINVDPTDNKTFWTTQEYVGTYGGWCPWATKITSFKTSSSPGVMSLAANPITVTGATLNGNVNPNGLATNYHFEYGTTTSYGTNTSTVSAGSGTSNVAVTASISGLIAASTYHFRLVAVNSDGTTYGNDLTFTTLGSAIVSTTAVTSIAQTTASSGGNVTSDGGFTVTARGVCWATTANPIASGSHTSNGTGTGVFTSSLTSLTPATTYHIRAYATNANGTFYGSDLTFTTAGAAVVTTTSVTSITQTTATSGGNVTSDGGSAVTARGVCWGTALNPIATGSHTTDGSGTGVFTSSITGLTANTLYHLRAYATNGNGTFYGNDLTFMTSICPPGGIFAEGFEGTTFPPSCWSLASVSGTYTWARSTAASGYGTGTASAMADFFNQSSGTYDLKSLSLNLAGLTSPSLKFDYAYATYSGEVDQMNVYYSTDNGSSFTLLLEMPGGTSGILNTGGATTASFVPTPAQWGTRTIPLPAGTNMVKFTAISAFGNNLYLDNVQVLVPPAHDVSATSIDLTAVHTTGTFSPLATVTNNGTNSETFPVTMTIGTYTSTKTVTALAVGTSRQITFDNWTAATGTYTIQVCTQLTGDLVTANDCRSQPIKILNLDKQVYAYNAYTGTGTDPVGPTSFNLSTPGTLNSIANQSALQFVKGATWAEGVWYGTVYNAAAPYDFVSINPVTGARTIIGTQTPSINGLSYNPANSIMYGVGWDGTNSSLYSINLATGAPTFIGVCGTVMLINLAINNAGAAYAIDLGADVLGTVNLTTGVFTTIGPIGFNANYAQDMEFDRSTGELYAAAYSTNGWLGWVNQTTGAILKIGDFEGGAEVTGLAIPYSSSVTQSISLSTGWNIMSFAVSPTNMSLMAIVNPLITAAMLTKIQDETGNAIEKLPDPIGWVDNIGLMKVSEGYKIKVTANTSLSATGQPVTLPYTILLNAGWNIMGYPSMNSQVALTAFQPLITAATLVKVQDEAGNAIEKLPDPIGWVDNIHSLTQGNGYKVKTTINTSLAINSSAKGEDQVMEASIIRPSHFKLAYTGNGLDQMNIYLKYPTIGGVALKTGDEIGVFDGGLCVGATVVDVPNQQYLPVTVSLDDPTTRETDGFNEGNNFELRLYDSQAGLERKPQNVELTKGYNKLFERFGTSVLAVDFETVAYTFLGDAFPNPSTDKTTFTFQLVKESRVRLEIYNMEGDLIKVLVDQKMAGGIHKIEWNNCEASGLRASSGVYLYTLKIDNFLQTKQMVIR